MSRQDEETEDPLDAARGIMFGVAAGAAIWVVIYLIGRLIYQAVTAT